MRWIKFPALSVVCLGLMALVLACGAAPPVAPDTPEPEPRTPTPAPDVESPLPTPAPDAESPLPTPAGDGGPTPEATQPSGQVPVLTPRPPITGEVPAALLDSIRADLAERLGVDADEIEVIRGEFVTWNDGSLGCPQPGRMYTQAVEDGYRVVLEHDGRTYDYRAGQGGSFVLCERGLAPVVSPSARAIEEVDVPAIPTIPTPSSPGLQGLVAQARENLAQRLSIPAEQIELVEVRPVVWPDGAMGCPQPGMSYIQVQQEGLLIRLRAGKQVYSYHSGGGTPPFLCEQAVE